MDFFSLYSEAVLTSLGYFWKALWAFVLGYVISSMIQVFVTRDRMQKAMGEAGRGSIDYTVFLNLAFLAITGLLAWLAFGGKSEAGHGHHHGGDRSMVEQVLFWLAMVSYLWLAGGLLVTWFG